MQATFESILCAVDFSRYSRQIIQYANDLAACHKARLLIFHAVNFPRNPIHGTVVTGSFATRKAADEHAKRQIADIMADCTVDWKAELRHGDPVEEILAVCESEPVDLVIAASHGLTGLRRVLLGSIVEQLAHRTKCPLLIMRSKHMHHRKKNIQNLKASNILIGCSFDKDLPAVIAGALAFVPQLGPQYHFVHALEAPLDEQIIDPSAGPYSQVQQQLQEKILKKVEQALSPFNISAEKRSLQVVSGHPGEQLASCAESTGADLVVIGVRPRKTLARKLVGSTAEMLLRHSPCPVLTVPTAADTGSYGKSARIEQTEPQTGIVFDYQYLEHRTGEDHPESHRRLQAIYDKLDLPSADSRVGQIVPREAAVKELELVHAPEYVAKIAATENREHTSLSGDTHTSTGSYRAASLAVGGLFEATEQVVAGHLQNAFALVRPPGHHAEKSRALGFCLFNNIALTAQYARQVMGLKRVLIFDWDVHHGNGTQHIFESDPSVLFFSIHQYPHFPGTGFFTEAGRGAGEGYTINIPLAKGYGDGEYIELLEHLLRPIALEFNPDLILVSAGFDIHRSDPLGGMRVTRKGFAGMTRSLMDIAQTCCGGKIVMSLEGGYNLKTVGGCVKTTLDEMAGRTTTDYRELGAKANPKKLAHVLKRCVGVHQRFWKNLSDPW